MGMGSYQSRCSESTNTWGGKKGVKSEWGKMQRPSISFAGGNSSDDDRKFKYQNLKISSARWKKIEATQVKEKFSLSIFIGVVEKTLVLWSRKDGGRGGRQNIAGVGRG